MKSNLLTKENIINLIVIALVVVTYAWTWIRGDWQSGYETVQNCVALFAVSYFCLIACKKAKKD